MIGGSALPAGDDATRSADEYGVEVIHAWGMTEMSPLGTLCTLKTKHLALPADEQQQRLLQKQGRAIFGVDMKIVDDDGTGRCPGTAWPTATCWCAGPWVVASYFKGEGGAARLGQRTAGSRPATSPPSTPTATCRSPTAART